MTWPLVGLGIAAAAVGVFVEDAYKGLTDEWADQTFAQDIVDLVVAFPLLAIVGWRSVRGSAVALLLWVGVIVAVLYTYVIYAFAVAFGPLYLANVTILGLSGWALIGAIRAIDGPRVQRSFTERVPTRSTGIALIVLGCVFYALWLLEDVPAVIRGEVPESLQDVGLPTNPIHVLDMAFLLPASIAAGVSLLRRLALGYWLAPALLTTLAVITVGIVTIIVLAIADGETEATPVAVAMTLVGAAQVLLLVRFLRHLRPGTRSNDLTALRDFNDEDRLVAKR
ncbi:MAG TPA: hypothetical protein VG144_00435 [Gaiellaceae bacterium]|nr:hypothetical protein [Gaiellaceae bacterium]